MSDVKVTMPQMGESIVEGTILSWLKAEGEQVEEDEPLLEISTEKVDSDLPSPASGVLKEIIVQEGETVDVGTELAVISTEVEAVEEPPAEAPPEEEEEEEEEVAVAAEAEPKRPEATPAEAPAPRLERDGRRITPVVARLLEEHDIDLGDVEGTGQGGRVTKQDVLGYLEEREAEAPPKRPKEKVEAEEVEEAEAPPAPPPERAVPKPRVEEAEEAEEAVPLKGIRKTIAEHMVRSVRTSPHVTTVAEVDFTRLAQFRGRVKEEFQQEEGVPLTYLPFIVRAVCHGLERYPYLNSSLQEDEIVLKRYYHIGVAVALEDGLIVPVLRHADRMDIRQIARALHDLAERGRARKLKVEELQGGTFTITNPGAFGAVLSTPIIYQPQAAILGVEAIQPRPVARDGEVVVRNMGYFCLSYDHRILDGATAIQFLQYVRRLLENPLNLIL